MKNKTINLGGRGNFEKFPLPPNPPHPQTLTFSDLQLRKAEQQSNFRGQGDNVPLQGFGDGVPKNLKGVTLLETIIALGLWLVLSAGVLFVWHYSVHRGVELMESQSALENGRIAMDVIKMNFQMSRSIVLETEPNSNILRTVTMNQRNPQGQWHDFAFNFRVNSTAEGWFQRLNFPNPGNHIAENIALIEIEYVNESRMRITITTACDEPIVLESSVCVRYKCVTVI